MTLGCARNEVDSEELAGRLAAGGWEVADGDDADVVLVNTCAFVASAKKDSIDTLLAAADGGRPVVAVGCLAERYGAELADSLPEASAVLGFDAYAEIGDRLDDVLAGRPLRRTPRGTGAPCCRSPPSTGTPPPGPSRCRATAPPVGRPTGPAPAPAPAGAHRLGAAGAAPPAGRLAGRAAEAGLAAVTGGAPSARSRASAARSCPAPPDELLTEARWLAGRGVREFVLVSENSTSYGKDSATCGCSRRCCRSWPRCGDRPGPAVAT